jgi:hypothetical protein
VDKDAEGAGGENTNGERTGDTDREGTDLSMDDRKGKDVVSKDKSKKRKRVDEEDAEPDESVKASKDGTSVTEDGESKGAASASHSDQGTLFGWVSPTYGNLIGWKGR